MGLFAELCRAVDAGEPAAMALLIGRPGGLVIGHAGVRWTDITDLGLLAAAREAGERALSEGRPVTVDHVYAEPHFPPPELVICGGGHVGQAVAEMAAMAGLVVTVIDDRSEYARPERFPRARRVLCAPFNEALTGLGLSQRHHMVIATRGHQHDSDCLRVALAFPVGYIGMIGSRRRVDAVFQVLRAEGLDPGLLGRVYAPIGLDIGASSAAEIAVSIVAELIRARRGGTGEHLSRLGRSLVHPSQSRRSSPDLDLLRLVPAHEPAALATIIRYRGHCPREVGAKMLVYRDGRTHGSVGGGCGEAEVRRIALDVIDTGHQVTHTVDLLDDPSLPEGSVCGGKFEVLIQPTGGGSR